MDRRVKSIGMGIVHCLVYALLLVGVLFCLYPFIWMFSTSMKTNVETIVNPWSLFPEHFSFDNYSYVISKTNIPVYFVNSILVSVISVFVLSFFAALAAFALGRLKFRGKNFFLTLIVLGMTLPYQIALTPLFALNKTFHLTNSLFSLIGPYIAYNIPFTMMVIRAFFIGFPTAIEEAAIIDGSSKFRMFFTMHLPMSMSAIVVGAIFSFVSIWNEYLFALTFISDEKKKTIIVGLNSFVGEFKTDWAHMSAGMVIATLPLLIGYIFCHKKMEEAVVNGAVKG